MRTALLALVGLVCVAGPTGAGALDLTAGTGVVEGCPASGASMRFDGAAVAYAEPSPVLALTAYGDGHYEPSPGNNIGVGIGYADVAGSAYGMCVALFDRADYYAEASKDLLDILVGNHHGNTFDSGRTYQLSMSEQSFRADGLRLGKTFPFSLGARWSARLGVAVSYLHGTEGDEQSLAGQVSATSADYAVGEATWVRTQTDINYATFNPFVAPGTARGEGFSSDIELVIGMPTGATLTAQAMDAIGRIYWQEVPHSIRALQNTDISYNANLDRDAFINGIDSRIGLTEQIPTKLRVLASLPLVGAWRADLENDEVKGFNFPSFGPSIASAGFDASAHFDLRTKALELGGRFSWIAASLTSNRLRLDRASALGAALHLSHTW